MPLFGYIYDTSKIIDIENDAETSPVTLIRNKGSENAPLFANNVVHNTESTDYAKWTVIAGANEENAENLGNFSGVFGTIEERAVVDISFSNNALFGTVYSDCVATNDVGLICNTMKNGSRLTVYYDSNSTNKSFNVTSSNGNAGGFVGSMDGATLEIKNSFTEETSVTVTGNTAGGVVGYAKDSVVTIADAVNEISATVNGENGTGGVFGKYTCANDSGLTLQNLKISCDLQGKKAGGVFGHLENNSSGTVTVDSTNTINIKRTTGETTNFGGVVGEYSTSVTNNSLEISGVTVNVNLSVATNTSLGGFVGSINTPSYVKFSDVTANIKASSDELKNFGGLVGLCNNGGFVDADNVKITTSSSFYGGGLVAQLDKGILRLSGKTDLSGAKVVDNNEVTNGQIVGKRGQSLVYATSGWKLIRSESVPKDDIGTWGQVVRFSDTFREADVLDIDNTYHTVTVKPAVTTLKSVADFAKTALNIQLNYGTDAGLLKFDPSSEDSETLLSSTITLGEDIDLTGTGFIGFTRDYDSNTNSYTDDNNITFKGTLDGNNHTLTLAIGEVYGYRGEELTPVTDYNVAGNGQIHYHNRPALFAKSDTAELLNITIKGGITFFDKTGIKSGGFSSVHNGGNLTVTGCTVSPNIKILGNSGNIVDVGGLVGNLYGKSQSSGTMIIDITNTTFGTEVYSKNNNRTIGGAIGWIDNDSFNNSSFKFNLSGVRFECNIESDTSTNVSAVRIGAFISEITGGSTKKGDVILDNVTLDGTSVNIYTNNGNCSFGLLASQWYFVDTEVKSLTVTNSSITQNGSREFGGLAYLATGYWKVNKIDIQSLTINAQNVGSLGLIVNKGFDNNNGLYLELTNENAYTVNKENTSIKIKNDAVFDELVAYTKNSNILDNNNAVVSIHTSNGTVKMDGENCNTYQNQTSIVKNNSNTRYYYNLDVIRGKKANGDALTYGEKLLLWSVNAYATNNIKRCFENPFSNNTIPSGNYDLNGLSYYPVTASGVTISNGASFKFYNNEIDASENGAGNTDGLTRLTTSNPSSQHFGMHCGLFYNVTGAVVINGATLSGNVGANDATKIKIKFSNIVLDGRTEALSSDTANTALNEKYHTEKSLFKNALFLQSFTGTSLTGVYNFRYSEDWNETDNPVHNVTYGKEISETTEYVGLQNKYIGSDYYVSPETPKKEDSAYSFATKFLPYVATPYDATKNTHEIKVNHTNKANFEIGCGTYNDPYIISDGEQLSFVAGVISGDIEPTDGTIVNFLNIDNFKTWCSNKNEHIRYVWDTDKFYKMTDEDTFDPNVSVDLATIQKSFSTAYFKLGRDITLPNTYIGLGDSLVYSFKGVIDGSGYTITNKSTAPLIVNSTGCVIKDVTVKVDVSGNIALSQTQNAQYNLAGSCTTYGAVIGQVFGGDNIIDNVKVTFAEGTKITTSGSWENLIAVGGYVGVVRYGGVIFRNMSDGCQGITTGVCPNVADTVTKYLYQNPIIGRVLDGFAVNETTAYAIESAVLQNGTKNYSIADINKDTDNKIELSDISVVMDNHNWNIGISTITVPDSQSMFLLGCITMSGAGKLDLMNNKYITDYKPTGYGNNQMVRHGLYNNIGTNDSSSKDFETIQKLDKYVSNTYVSNTAEKFDTSSTDIKEVVPYIIYKYTTSSVTMLGNKTGTVNYPARTLTSKGSVFNITLSENTEYNLPKGFRGIGSVNEKDDFAQMYFYSIKGNGSTITMDTKYNLYEGNNDNYNTTNSGIGLFNVINQNKHDFIKKGNSAQDTDDYKIKNLTIKGNVHLTRYNKTNGNKIQTNNGTISAGGLGGCYNDNKCTIQLENVKLDNLDVFSNYNAGGLIGSISPNNADCYVNLDLVSAENITVMAGNQAGGLVGYSNRAKYVVKGENGEESTKFNNNTIKTTSSNSANYNAGGLFGRFDSTNLNLSYVDVTNGQVLADENNDGTEYIGGVIGYANNNSVMNFDNVSVLNVKISGGNCCGGLIGRLWGNNTKFTATNTKVVGTTPNAIINSKDKSSQNYGNAGGLLGFNNGTITVDNCIVKGYEIISDCTEGCGGYFGKSESKITVSNSVVKDCTLKVNNLNGEEVGGLVAQNSKDGVFGYNIVLDNVQITDLNGNKMTNTSTAGNIVGQNNGKNLQLAGVSLQKNQNGIYVDNAVGSGLNTSNSYIIYCDYEGVYENKTPSSVNNENNVASVDNTAFGTINPQVFIDSTNFLTGDGVSSKAFEKICNDIENQSQKAFRDLETVKTTFEDKYLNKLSTFKTETGAEISYDFPVLVINDTDSTKVTEMLNSYIHLLTGDTVVSNYAVDDTRYLVSISSYRLNNENRFEIPGSYKVPLERYQGQFRMSSDESSYDSNFTQFTLIDIQYKNPAGENKIAYHLYIPVMVEKMLKFDFKSALLTGTDYNVGMYHNGSSVLESYGTPITAHVTYSYKRTLQEWTDAIYGNENILKSYGKSVLLETQGELLPDETKLVLVDRNNNFKPYYSSVADAKDGKKLNFDRFKTAGNTAFESVSLYDLLVKSVDITATSDNDKGMFVECNENDATVKTTDGKFFRKKTDEETVGTFYSITLTNKDNSASKDSIIDVSEDYYLSFFTKASQVEPMRIIYLSCGIKLEDSGMTISKRDKVTKSTMILGNLYTQTFDFKTNSNEIITEQSNTIQASMNTSISIADDYKQTIISCMADESIHVYHGFVINAAKTDANGTEKGIKGSPLVSGIYKVGETEYPFSFANQGSLITVQGADQNGKVDIKEQLRTGNPVTISCDDLKIQYVENMDIIQQFPKRPSNQYYGAEVTNGSCEYVFDASNLNFENNVYEIRTRYAVITASEFEGKGYIYSNYKVLMTAQLLDENGNVISSSLCSDYIIYTNAKIVTELFTAS